MCNSRVEHDFLGERAVPVDALYGIHSVRALENFPYHRPFHKEWYMAVGVVKQAVYETYRDYKNGVADKLGALPSQFNWLDDERINALEVAAQKVAKGDYFDHFIVSSHQGGAGTSINMNVNEIITNLALKELGYSSGEYSHLDPLEGANIFQSTNDVIPTALRIAILRLLKDLEMTINTHRQLIEEVEGGCRNVLRQGYTQMQAAVPTSYDKLFSGYSSALSRDWWRVSKSFERIKEVNLGGGAVGTGLSLPRFYIMKVVQKLQYLTNLPIARCENLSDATANLDSFVEIHAILKAHAVNLEKMSSDLRLMGSDLFLNREVYLPQKQIGSSIMPTKVNPVIVEYVVQGAHRIYSNDDLVTRLSAQGCLDLNAYLPAIGDSILDSIKMLISMNKTLTDNLWRGFRIETGNSLERLYYSPTITTALISKIGYHKAAELGHLMNQEKISVIEANSRLGYLSASEIADLLTPSQLLQLGFVLG